MRKIKLFGFCALLLFLFFSPLVCRAMPPGTLLYRTSGNGKMYGYSGDPLIYSEKGILRNIYSGHVAVYIGQENGEDYIVEAAAGGIVKTPAKYFVNLAEGEEFLGAKIPENLTAVERAKAVAIAKSLVDKRLGYDFDFKIQKGPESGAWTCVGLTEKIYESAAISNPNNLGALEYNPDFYAVDITPDGFDDYSVVNEEGDCFSSDREFSKISRRTDLLLPAPELVGYDAGLEYGGDRYIFIPYTQFLQETLKDVPVDITVSSSFDGAVIRGRVPTLGLILKWSLINNPVSTISNIARKVKEVAVNLGSKIFSSSSDTALVLDDESNSSSAAKTTKTSAQKTTTAKTTVKSPVTVNKAPSGATSQGDKKTMEEATEKTKTDTAKNEPDETESTVKQKTETASKTEPLKIASTVKVNKIIPLQTPVTQPATQPVTNNNNSNSSSGSQSSNNSTSGSSGNAVEETTETTPVATPIVRINKVYATGDNDWLELFNPTDQSFDLAAFGYRLEKTKTAEDPSLIMRLGNEADGTYPGGTTIPAQGTYLIVRDDAKDYYKNKADAIATRDDFGWTGKDYTIYLGVDAVSSSDDPDIFDAVGFGSGATYYLGAGSAPEITDNYILARQAASGNNQTDYHLIPTDDPEAVFEEEEDTATSTSPAASNPGLFVAPTPLLSEDLIHLWHFDECYGTSSQDAINMATSAPADFLFPENWVAGKWGCAYQANYNSQALANFTQGLDSSNLTVSFRYRSGSEFSRLTLNLNGSETLSWSLNVGMNAFYGLPGVWGNYPFDFPFDDIWHQATLVINQAELYWSIYVDGQEKFHQSFADFMPVISSLSITNSNGPALIDELAIWNRALPQEEILAINNFDAPFWPVLEREAQEAPVLRHLWHFDEGNGLSLDMIASTSINVPDEAWAYAGKISHGLESVWNKDDIKAHFSRLDSKDLSLSFWYAFRDNLSLIDSRFRLVLRQGESELISLTPSAYRLNYMFNGLSGTISEGANNFLPFDNLWHHLALSYDSYRYLLHFYVDGQEVASSSQIWFADGVRPDNLLIKGENGSVGLDELRIWQGALSGTQVREIYNLEK